MRSSFMSTSAFLAEALRAGLTPSVPAPVDSVFGRTGAVAAAASDYDASQIDNDSGVTGPHVAAALDQLDIDKLDAADVSATPGTADAVVRANGSGDIPTAWLPNITQAYLAGRGVLSGTGEMQYLSPDNALLSLYSTRLANQTLVTQGTAGLVVALTLAQNTILARGTGNITTVTFAAGQILYRDATGLNVFDLDDALADFGLVPTITVTADEASSLSTGVSAGYQFSFGDRGLHGSGGGYPVKRAGTIVAVGVSFGNSACTGTVEVYKNGAATGVSVTGGGTSRINTSTGHSVSVVAGDRINFRTTAASGDVTGPHIASVDIELAV